MGVRPAHVSIHAFRGEGDTAPAIRVARVTKFQSTPSGGKATTEQSESPTPLKVSIHAFRGEGDQTDRTLSLSLFQSTPSGGKATLPAVRRVLCTRNSFNPRLPGGRRLQIGRISINKLSFNPRLPGGRRPPPHGCPPRFHPVSIHAFRGEGDELADTSTSLEGMFQSTPSGGKATSKKLDIPTFDPVSIHAFRGEGDSVGVSVGVLVGVFQSTPSGGKATWRKVYYLARQRSFNPRLPGGRRRECIEQITIEEKFQSTPSGGKATPAGRGLRIDQSSFNPRLPGGRRQFAYDLLHYLGRVSIHAFRGEGDAMASCMCTQRKFQSTPSGGKATPVLRNSPRGAGVSIHAFRGEGDPRSRLPMPG